MISCYLCCRGKTVSAEVDNSHILACIARNVKKGIRSEILDDSSIESFLDVDDIILCSNIQCATYDKEYSFESVHITEAPKGDWFCPSCRELTFFGKHLRCAGTGSFQLEGPCDKGQKTGSNSV